MGKLYRLINIINGQTKITIKTAAEKKINGMEIGETVRKGSVLGAAMCVSSMESITETAKQGKAMATIDNLRVSPLYFQHIFTYNTRISFLEIKYTYFITTTLT